MTYDADAAIEFELERLRLLQRQRHSERMGIRQEVLPAIKMIIGEWNVQIDFQWGLGDPAWIQSVAAQLLQLAPDLILANGNTGGEDNAAVEPNGSRHLHCRQRPSCGWLGAELSPSRR
jgi:hypothetical protein